MSLPIEGFRLLLERMTTALRGKNTSWQIDCELAVLSAVQESLPALLDELAELRNLATFVATKLRLEEEARSDGLPCKAMSARDEALSALAKHAGPWSPECAALSTYTMLDQACRENTEMLDELAELRAYRASTEAALTKLSDHCADEYADEDTLGDLGLLREPKAGEGGGS